MTHHKYLERVNFPFNEVAEREQFHCLCDDRWMVAKHFLVSDLLCVFPVVIALEVTHPGQSGHRSGRAGLGRTCGHSVFALVPLCSLGVITPHQAPWHKLCPPACSAGALHALQPTSSYQSFKNPATSAK